MSDINAISKPYISKSIWNLNRELAEVLRKQGSKIGKVFSGQAIDIEDLEIRTASVESTTSANSALISLHYQTLTDSALALSTRTLALESDVSGLRTDVDGNALSITSKADISFVQSTRTDLEGSIAQTSSNLTTAFQAADAVQQGEIDDLTTVVDTKASISQMADVESNAAGATAALQSSVNAQISNIESAAHNYAPNPGMNDKPHQLNAWPDGWGDFAISGGSGWQNHIGKGKDTNPDIYKDWFPVGVQGIVQHVPGPSSGHFSDLRSDWFHAPIFEKEMFHSVFTGAHRCWMEIHIALEHINGNEVWWTGGVDFTNYRNAEEQAGWQSYHDAKRIWIKSPIMTDTSSYTGRIRLILRMSNTQSVSNPIHPYAFWHSPMSEAKQSDSQIEPSPYSNSVDSIASDQIRSLNEQAETLNASVTTNALAVADIDARMTASYVLKGKAGTSEFEFAGYADGVAPSSLTLTADQIRLNGQVLLNNTVIDDKIASNSIAPMRFRSISDYYYDAVASGTGVWRTVGSVSIPVKAGRIVELDALLTPIFTGAVGADIRFSTAGWNGPSVRLRNHNTPTPMREAYTPSAAGTRYFDLQYKADTGNIVTLEDITFKITSHNTNTEI